jgi:hypothetical protein
MAGSPAVSGDSKFQDVENGKYYHDAVVLATSNGIVNGMSETEFAPNLNITREQLTVMLYNYCRATGLDVSESASVSSFDDSNEISSWAMTGLRWAVGSELVNGIGNNLLDPGGNATRAQIATLIMRLWKPSSSKPTFSS